MVPGIFPEKDSSSTDVGPISESVHSVKTTLKPICFGRIGLVGMLLALLVLPTAQAAGRWATLEAIHQLENPRNLTRPGANGEFGAYQFRASTWRRYTSVPFSRALERLESDRVAVAHYEWLRRGFERAGLTPTPYRIALAWNGGFEAAVSGRSPAVAHDYAQRAVNLAEELDRAARRRP
jgi:hypothetical protein